MDAPGTRTSGTPGPMRVAVGLLSVCIVAFLALARVGPGSEDLNALDASAHDALYGLIGPNEALVESITFLGNNATLIVLVVLVALGLLLARRTWLAARVVVASGVGGLVVLGLKSLFHRARPVEQIIPAGGFSFPSGHAFASTVFYGMMVVLVWHLTDRPWVRALASVLGAGVIVAVGLSRVYLNVHYLTDVLAGWSVGLAWLIASVLLIDWVEQRRVGSAEESQDG